MAGRRHLANDDDDVVRVKAVCVKETSKAVQVEVTVKGRPVTAWIAKSTLHDDSEVYDADDHATGTLVVPRWVAEDKGIERAD